MQRQGLPESSSYTVVTPFLVLVAIAPLRQQAWGRSWITTTPPRTGSMDTLAAEKPGPAREEGWSAVAGLAAHPFTSVRTPPGSGGGPKPGDNNPDPANESWAPASALGPPASRMPRAPAASSP